LPAIHEWRLAVASTDGAAEGENTEAEEEEEEAEEAAEGG
jgi:hypothetical protein